MTNNSINARYWLNFATEDMHAAEILHREDIPNLVCFHAQQCVEKMLKALLLNNQVACPKVHDLMDLYDRCINADIVEVLPFQMEIEMLSKFYLPTRYPDALVGSLPDGIPTEKDAQSALDAANKIFNQLRKGLSK